MSWFDAATGRPLRTVLAECIEPQGFGVVDVAAREGSGQVFYANGAVVHVSSADQPPLRSTLELSGAASGPELDDLARSARGAGVRRRDAPPAVAAVVRDLSEAALATLLALPAGSARVGPGATPPLGVLMAVPLEELAASAGLREVRALAARIASGTAWEATATGPVTLSPEEWRLLSLAAGSAAPCGPDGAATDLVSARLLLSHLAERGVVRRVGDPTVPSRIEAPSLPAPTVSVLVPTTSRSSALRRLIGAVRAG